MSSEGKTAARAAPRALTPVDSASLAVVRIAMGAVGLLSVARIVAYGWVDALYAGPTHRFTYLGLGWVPQPTHGQMVALLVAWAGCFAGAARRLAHPLGGAGLRGRDRVDRADRCHHLPQPLLVPHPDGACWRWRHPWGGRFSLDARRAGGPTTAARGWVWLLRFQVGVVYAFAGLAKLQPDWLLRALPLELWVPARAGVPVLGRLAEIDAVPHALAVAGAAFDCLIVPLLLWRRTRLPAWMALVAFHVCTWALFPIGVFPWLMIGASTVFFEPDWPRRLLARFAGRRLGARVAPVRRSCALLALRGACGSSCRSPSRCATSPTPATTAGRARATASPGTCCWWSGPAR